MALLALTAPANSPSGIVLGAGTALSGNTGFTVPWNFNLVVVVQSGATGAGVVTFQLPTGVAGPTLATLATTQNLILAGIPYVYAIPQASGPALIQVNVTTVTSATAVAYLALNGTQAAHCPIEMITSASDY